MARVFRGEGLHKVDAKGRVSIPALFRRTLEAADPDWTEGLNPNLVIVYGDHRQNHLECFSMEAIAEVDARINRMKRGSRERRMAERLITGKSLPTSVDETGRLVLPAKLRQKIGLEGDAYFIASGDTFQIWNPATYEAEEAADTESWLDDQDEDFDIFSILPEDEA
ncbi:division/cell wall cluster transcriptional repressor MraZ [Maritimibacter sp. DP1N21-5]|uniref:division/cell wall cluster transcriptional repressor MraZ n=1 Tax=Maritimibacter sp. DP1N21-5 TaxID=2836867 RepID=UPI001C4477EA|nr:division/cell wall cluster transcriptional repressor MraZ [Maritimibacter sp. DP1N21-5]